MLGKKEVESLVEKSNWISFDSERGAAVSDVCRKTKDGQLSCVKVGMTSMELAAFMNKAGFICMANADPRNTAIECRRIAEKPLDEL